MIISSLLLILKKYELSQIPLFDIMDRVGFFVWLLSLRTNQEESKYHLLNWTITTSSLTHYLQVWPPTAALVFRFPHLLNMETEMLRRWRRVRRKASVCARPRCIKAPLGVGFIVRHHRRGWNVQNQCLPTTLWLLFRPKNHMDLPKAMGRVHEAEYM